MGGTYREEQRPTGGRRSSKPGAKGSGTPLELSVKGLQSAAGNQAVAASLGGTSDTTVQRTPKLVAAEDRHLESRADATAAKARDVTPTPDPRKRLDGAPLAPAHQDQLQRLTGADVSGINIHTGPASTRSNADLGAHAYTKGTDIHFGKGEYDPGSWKGFQLLAHEVTHAVDHPTSTSRDGADVVHAKLKGTHQALVQLGGDAGKSLRKKLVGSKWNELLSQLGSYEKLESAYLSLVANPNAKGAKKKQAESKKKMLKALTKLEQTALAWRQANQDDLDKPAETNKERFRRLGMEEDQRAKAGRRQAVSMFLTRVRTEAADLATGRWEATTSGLDDSSLDWGKDNAVGGGINRLDAVGYATDEGPILEGYFKQEQGFSRMAGPDENAGINQFDANWGGRSLAMYRLDKLLQGGVIARTEFAVHTSRTETKDPATGKKTMSEATSKLGFFTEKASGEEMSKLIADGRVSRTEEQRKQRSDPAAAIDTEDPVLQRCLNKLQVIDAISGQLDRHEGNYFVQRDPVTGKVLGVTGIDNDMAFGSDSDTLSFRGAHNYIGMPELVDEQFGKRILQIREQDIRATLEGLLAPAEVDATVQRFTLVQDVVKSLDAKGELTSDWNKATAAATREDEEVGRWSKGKPYLVGRINEKVWGLQDHFVEQLLKSEGVQTADGEAIREGLSARVHGLELEAADMVPVTREVLARMRQTRQPTEDDKGQPQFTTFGDKVVQRLLSEVLLKRQMSRQLDQMMGGRR